MKQPREHYYAIALALGGGSLMFWFTLNRGALAVWDEQIYANVAQNMLRGHWLIPQFTLNDHPMSYAIGPFLEKPPLFMWLQAISMAVVGPTPTAARLPSVVAFAALVAVVVELGARLWTPEAGGIAGLTLIIANPSRNTHAATAAATDILLLLFGTLLVYALVRSRSDSRWFLTGGATFGLAFMTKGVAAVPFAVLAAPLLLTNLVPLRARELTVGVGAAAAVALPWHLIALALEPSAFIDQYVLEQVVDRATGAYGSDKGGLLPMQNYPYFQVLPGYIGLVGVGVVGAVGVDILRRSRADLGSLFCYWWLLLFPLGYAVGGGNLKWYILPVVVPVALLAGRFGNDCLVYAKQAGSS